MSASEEMYYTNQIAIAGVLLVGKHVEVQGTTACSNLRRLGERAAGAHRGRKRVPDGGTKQQEEKKILRRARKKESLTLFVIFYGYCCVLWPIGEAKCTSRR